MVERVTSKQWGVNKTRTREGWRVNGGERTKHEREKGGERTAGSAVVVQKARSWGLSFRKDVGQWGLVKSGE